VAFKPDARAQLSMCVNQFGALVNYIVYVNLDEEPTRWKQLHPDDFHGFAWIVGLNNLW